MLGFEILAALTLVAPAFAAETSNPTAVGTIAAVAGSASIKRDAPTGTTAPTTHALAANEEVHDRDVLSTGPNSTIKILFVDNTILDLGPNTIFKIDHFEGKGLGTRSGVFTMLQGRIRALVTKIVSGENKVEFRTADAVMGVRGTELIVHVPIGASTSGAPRTELTVLSGSVAMTLPKFSSTPVLVPPNTRVVASADLSAPPTPVKLSSEQATAIAREARVQNNTFDRTVIVEAGVQNDKAPPAATSRRLSPDLIVAAREALATQTEPLLVRATGRFNPADFSRDSPTNLLPGNFRTVTVKLVQ